MGSSGLRQALRTRLPVRDTSRMQSPCRRLPPLLTQAVNTHTHTHERTHTHTHTHTHTRIPADSGSDFEDADAMAELKHEKSPSRRPDYEVMLLSTAEPRPAAQMGAPWHALTRARHRTWWPRLRREHMCAQDRRACGRLCQISTTSTSPLTQRFIGSRSRVRQLDRSPSLQDYRSAR